MYLNVARPLSGVGRMSKTFVSVAAALLVAGVSACASDAAGQSGAASVSAAPTTSTGPTGQESPSGAATAAWRGAAITVAAGWWPAAVTDTDLCIVRTDSSDDVCDGVGKNEEVQDWLFFYASPRTAIRGTPPDPKTLDVSDMGFWMYNGGEPACDDWSRNDRVDSGTKAIGKLTAYYGKWLVTCKDNGKSFTAQRWLLPKSRLGVVSYALTPASADEIFQMVTAMDLTGYAPTK